MFSRLLLSAVLVIFCGNFAAVFGQQPHSRQDAPPNGGYGYPSYPVPTAPDYPPNNAYPPAGAYDPPHAYPPSSASPHPNAYPPPTTYPATGSSPYPGDYHPAPEYDAYGPPQSPYRSSFAADRVEPNGNAWTSEWDACEPCQSCDAGNGRSGRQKCGCHSGNHCRQPDCRNCNWGPAYLAFFGGGSFIDNLDTRRVFDIGVENTLGVEEFGFSTESSGAIGGSIGRYFYRRLRVELEYTYRANDFSEANRYIYEEFTPPNGNLPTPPPMDGDMDEPSTGNQNSSFQTLISAESAAATGPLNSHSFLANWLFELKPRAVGCFNGYIGGGIGALYADGTATTATEIYTIDDTAFAYQGIGGISYPVRDRIDLYAEYRYLGANELDVSRTNDAGTESLGSFRFDSHNVFFGIRLLR